MLAFPPRLLVVIPIYVLFSINLCAQLDAGLLALKNGNYSAAFTTLTEQASKKKTAVIGHFGLAQLHNTEASSYFDLQKANAYGKSCNTLLREVKKRDDKDELKAIGVSSKILRALRAEISGKAIASAREENSPEALGLVIKEFRLSPEQKDTLKQEYGKAVVERVAGSTSPQKANEILEAYERQLNRYSPEAYKEGETAVFEKFLDQKGWSEFASFQQEFSDNRFARDNGAATFIPILETSSIDAYENFTKKYQYSAFTPIAQDSIAELRRVYADNKAKIANQLDTLSTYEGLVEFEQNFQTVLSHRVFENERQKLEQKLFVKFTEEKGWAAFSDFQEVHPKNRFVLDRAAKPYLAIAESENLEAFQSFAQKYSASNYKIFADQEIERLSNIRTELSNQASRGMEQFKEPADLYAFQEKYREKYAKYAPALNAQLDALVLERYLNSKGLEAFSEFQQSYPQNAFASDQTAPAFLAVSGSGNLSAFESFLQENPKTTFREMALDSIRFWKDYRYEFNREVKKALNTANSYEKVAEVDKKYRKKIAKYSPALQEQVDRKLLKSYVDKTGGAQLSQFKKEHPNNKEWNQEEVNKFRDALKGYDLIRYREFVYQYPGSVFEQIAKDSIRSYESKLEPSEALSFSQLQKRLKGDMRNKDWETVLKKIREAGPSYTDDLGMYNELTALIKAPETGIVRNEMSERINDLGSAYVPIVTADSKALYFCGKSFSNSKGLEDIFVSKKEGGKWGDPELIDDLSTSGENEAALSISADGNTLILFLGGKVGFSKKTSEGWSEPQLYPPQINIGSWQGDAIITADGKAMFFVHSSSSWSGDYNIYVSEKQADGSWGKAQKLDNVINTGKEERMPFLHPDMKTLYFSSSGHGGMGGMDVYVSTREDMTRWDKWSEPRNLGKEVNTVDDDWGYKVSTDGRKAYFAAKLSYSKQQLYEVNLPEEFRPDQVVTIEGKVEGLDKLESATIVVVDSKTKEEITRISTEPGTGEYFIVVPEGVEPEVKVEKDGVYSPLTKIDVATVGTKKKENKNVKQDLAVVDFNQEKVDGLSITFDDVLFETDQFVIREQMAGELANLAAILAERGVKTTISGYTDDVGSLEYNETLSRKRAEAVKAFLVEKGCKAENITARGYGESNPIAPNNTEEGRAKNRRVEFSFD